LIGRADANMPQTLWRASSQCGRPTCPCSNEKLAITGGPFQRASLIRTRPVNNRWSQGRCRSRQESAQSRSFQVSLHLIDIRKIDRVRPVCNVESRCSVHRSCRRRVRFKQPYRSSPCGNRPCGRPAQQENEFSPLQFLELHLLAMVNQWGVCNNLAILASFSIPLTPRRLRVRHSGAFCINGIAQRPSLDANTGKNSRAR